VICLRSAGEAARKGGCGVDTAAAFWALSDGEADWRLAPHSEQKWSAGGLRRPHEEHGRGNGWPHLLQNFAPSRTQALQLGHCITTSLEP